MPKNKGVFDSVPLAASYLLSIKKKKARLNILPNQDSLAEPVSSVQASSQVSDQCSGSYLLSFIYNIVKTLSLFSWCLPNL